MTGRKSFGSDNHTGAHPAVIRAIVAANSGDAVAYGADEWTERVTAALSETFEAAGGAFLVLNGSGANVLGLSVLLRRHEAVICAASAHINTDECGAPERLVGTKLLTVPAPDGKLTPELIAGQLGGQGDEQRGSQSCGMAGSAPLHAEQRACCHSERQPESNVGPMKMERHGTFRFQRHEEGWRRRRLIELLSRTC